MLSTVDSNLWVAIFKCYFPHFVEGEGHHKSLDIGYFKITAQKQNIPSMHSMLGGLCGCKWHAAQWPKLIDLCKLFSLAFVSFHWCDVAPPLAIEGWCLNQGMSL